MAWKTAKNRKWKKKNGNRNGKRPQAGQGQKWQKKWPKNGRIMENSLKNPFFGHFCPFPAWGHFPFRFPFFFHFRFLAVFHAIPARQDPNPLGESKKKAQSAIQRRSAAKSSAKISPELRITSGVQFACSDSEGTRLYRERAEYCFESIVSGERTH